MVSLPPDLNIGKLKRELKERGFVVIHDLIPRDQALRIGDRLMEIMSALPDHDNPDGEQIMDRLFDRIEPIDDDMFLPLVTNPVHLDLVGSLLGPGFQQIGPGILWRMPGCLKRGLHADVPLPWFIQNNLPTQSNVCFMVNAIWMLNEFTRENGATLLLPHSHNFGHVCNKWVDPTSGKLRYENENIRRYRTKLESEGDNQLVASEGPPGSLLIFHGSPWHSPGPNITTDSNRLGASTGFIPAWLDPVNTAWGKDALMSRATRNRMPPDVQMRNQRVKENYPDTSNLETKQQ